MEVTGVDRARRQHGAARWRTEVRVEAARATMTTQRAGGRGSYGAEGGCGRRGSNDGVDVGWGQQRWHRGGVGR